MKKIIVIIILSCLVFDCDKEGKNAGTDRQINSVVKGNSSRVQEHPLRIISLAPAITEELFLLEADDMLVANTHYCKRPEKAKKIQKIGNLKNFDIEKILELKPDLILCTTLANSGKIQKLKQFGIKVTELPPARTFDEICSNFSRLGSAINKNEKAKRIISDVRQEVEQIKKLNQNLPKKKVFMQIGAKPLVTVNRDYFINDYIKYAGGINISGNVISNRYSRESVLAEDPDVIIITNMGIASDEEKQTWKSYPALTAVKNNDIFIVDSDVFCNPTITTFLESLKAVTKMLHPEKKI
jgi:iron complex transport system substrate-binding protein